ncbi:YihY/virulence factor BrkB family protein [Pararhodobacter sp.]|uniref:YihY/virulence factor BrkB family protein n=1 Tax=Pararhodobacter sp. TaxID=2127056 RepID=UPI002FE12388
MSRSWLQALPRLAMRVAVRMYQEVISDQIGLLAAGIAFYALLAIFPAMASVLAILGIFFSASEITGPVETATAAIPPSAASLIREQASSIVAADHSALGVTAVVGLIAALYATARGMRHLIQGLNVAFNETESRGLIMRWLAIILLAVFVICGALMGMAAIAVIPILLALFPEEAQAQSIVSVIRWVALFSISTAGIAVIYRFGPDRRHRSWHWTLPGAVVACLLWVIASAGFSLYAENFASYQRSFGALTGVIVLLTWLWLSTYVLLLGAELNAALEAVFHGERKRRAAAPEGATAESLPRD